MRVIAGNLRRRPLRSLPGLDVRPTSDRLREALFNVLTGGDPAALEGTTWIDLFAGTGSVGIEAISRGAAQVYFVEKSAEAAKLILENLKSLQLTKGFQILPQDWTRALEGLRKKTVAADFVFLDPPYRMETLYSDSLAEVASTGMVNANGLVIAEHHKKFNPGQEYGTLRKCRTLQQGDSALSFYRHTT